MCGGAALICVHPGRPGAQGNEMADELVKEAANAGAGLEVDVRVPGPAGVGAAEE